MASLANPGMLQSIGKRGSARHAVSRRMRKCKSMSWIEMSQPDGKKFLLNTATVVCIIEGPDGNAIAVSIAGAQIAIGEKYAAVASDAIQESEL